MLFLDFQNKEQLLQAFSSEKDCIDYLEKLRWNSSIISPFSNNSKIYVCKNNKYKCRTSGKYFNVKTKTLFHDTKIDLRKWFLAIWIISRQDSKINSVDLGHELGVTQKSAWYMIKRIKLYMQKNDKTFENRENLVQRSEIIESTYQKNDNPNESNKLQLLQWLQLMKK